MSEQKHSPLPWRIGKDASVIRDPGDGIVGDCYVSPDPADIAEADANAALIVECVNAHTALKAQRDELLAFVESANEAIEQLLRYRDGEPDARASSCFHAARIVDTGRALLARIRAPAGEVKP